MKKILSKSVGIVILLTTLFLFQSAPIDPAAYTPSKPPALTGVLSPNTLLQKAELLGTEKILMPLSKRRSPG